VLELVAALIGTAVRMVIVARERLVAAAGLAVQQVAAELSTVTDSVHFQAQLAEPV
jgi:hypothetical protein